MTDDAIHIRHPLSGVSTLCGQQIHRVWNVISHKDARPDWGSGCWTCLQKAEAMDAWTNAPKPKEKP